MVFSPYVVISNQYIDDEVPKKFPDVLEPQPIYGVK